MKSLSNSYCSETLTHVKFPEDILDLRRNLRTLDVSNNRIEELPDDIGVMQMLRTFKIDDNKLGGFVLVLEKYLSSSLAFNIHVQEAN